MEIPVYLVTGFLDGGKTSFINDILEEGFAEDGKTLLLSFEEGEVEYTKKALSTVVLETLSDKDSLDYGYLKTLEKKHRPKQIVVEYNGMWTLDTFLDILPSNWILYQVMTFVEASTFDIYSKNLGQLMMEKITNADMLVFNRCTDELKESLRSRNLRMVNRRCDIFLEGFDGKAENYLTGDECFFDLNQDIIDIPDDDYGLWYVDVMDHPERYDGKKVHMKLMMLHSVNFPGACCPGRFAMVCCEADITFFGILAKGDALNKFKDKDWIEVTAEMSVVNHPAYDTGDGPCMNILTALPCDKPRDDVVGF